jgi:hypothetical protein
MSDMMSEPDAADGIGLSETSVDLKHLTRLSVRDFVKFCRRESSETYVRLEVLEDFFNNLLLTFF